MREIKARAWFPKAKRMIHFEGLIFCDEYDRLCLGIREVDCTNNYQHLAGESFLPDEEGITSWYTGYKDKNGVEIYESDLVVHHSRNGGKPHLVIFDLKQAAWCGDYGLKYPFKKAELDEMEVIGNVFENPEMKVVGE